CATAGSAGSPTRCAPRWWTTSPPCSRRTAATARPTRGRGAGRSRGASTCCRSSTRSCRRWFLHWLRDGRDMAFSENQQQLKKHGDTVLRGDDSGKQPVRSIRLWSKVNSAAADFGEQQMPGRYLRIRFEDLCAQPAETVARIYEFFGLEGDVEQAAAEVRPPDTLGRWRKSRRKVLE